MTHDRKVILYIATSIDGFIAKVNDDLDWLYSVEQEGDAGYGAMLESVDTLIMGKSTYEFVRNSGVPWPYTTQKTFVYSNSSTGTDEYVEYTNEEPKSLIKRLKSTPGKNIWFVGGGTLAGEFFKDGLVDVFMLGIAPLILGKGISLYQQEELEVHFQLTDIKKYGQLAMLHYEKK